MKEGQKSPDYEVATDFWIDKEKIGEEELKLIESVMPDIIRLILDDEEIEENKK